jgi:hypothetical protein
MSTTESTLLLLLKDIVLLLSARKAYWKKCSNVTVDGLTASELLILLQEQDINWTEELLTIILSYGIKIGALRKQAIIEDLPSQYLVNINMIFENNKNMYFKTFVPCLPTPSLKPQVGRNSSSGQSLCNQIETKTSMPICDWYW